MSETAAVALGEGFLPTPSKPLSTEGFAPSGPYRPVRAGSSEWLEIERGRLLKELPTAVLISELMARLKAESERLTATIAVVESVSGLRLLDAALKAEGC